MQLQLPMAWLSLRSSSSDLTFHFPLFQQLQPVWKDHTGLSLAAYKARAENAGTYGISLHREIARELRMVHLHGSN